MLLVVDITGMEIIGLWSRLLAYAELRLFSSKISEEAAKIAVNCPSLQMALPARDLGFYMGWSGFLYHVFYGVRSFDNIGVISF